MLTCQRYAVHRTEEQGLTQRKELTCLSSKGRIEVAELMGICRNCPHTFCPSKQILLEGEVGEREGFLILQRPFALAETRETHKNKQVCCSWKRSS